MLVPHDSANLLALRTPLLFLHLKAEDGKYICEQLLCVFLFRHREFFVDSSGEGFEHGGFDGFLEYGQWRQGWTMGSPWMALVPRPRQHFDEGRDTGGVRGEMAATDMGSSSVQEQARVRKDQGWYLPKAGSLFRRLRSPVSLAGETGSKTLHEYDGPQDDSTRQEMTSFRVHDKPNISLSA
ncbi:hypothetical protein BU17DRAFT_101622 [Hysterangium stoloniferum]|nr:hypothetical protein BU17DRAFT_101622 [Hysterangium stoloniferum]